MKVPRWSRGCHSATRARARATTPGVASRSDIIRLLIVDDHPVLRDGLQKIFQTAADLEVVGQAADGTEALSMVAALDPDVVLMDLRMPNVGGVAAIRSLRVRGARAKVLVLTTYDSDADVLQAVQAGAAGYLLKDAPGPDLVHAVRAAHAGAVAVGGRDADDANGRSGRRAPSDRAARAAETEPARAGGAGTGGVGEDEPCGRGRVVRQ